MQPLHDELRMNLRRQEQIFPKESEKTNPNLKQTVSFLSHQERVRGFSCHYFTSTTLGLEQFFSLLGQRK